MKNRVFALSVLSILSLASCGSHENTVGLFIYDSTDTFMTSFAGTIEQGFDDMGVKYLFKGAERNQTIQNQQVISLLDEGSNLLVINLVDRLAASALIEMADEKNTNLIFINREPLQGDLSGHKNTFYVGSDSEQAGDLQASLAEQLFTKPEMDAKTCPYDKNKDGIINLVVIKGEEGHQDTELRTDRCTKRLVEDGYAINVLTTATGNWTTSGGYEAMGKIAKEYYDPADPDKQQIELVYCNNDDMAAGAVNYLKDNHVLSSNSSFADQPIQIIGFDGTQTGLKLVEDGFIYGTVLNDAVTQGSHVCALANKILNNEDTSNVIQIDRVSGKTITKSTL